LGLRLFVVAGVLCVLYCAVNSGSPQYGMYHDYRDSDLKGDFRVGGHGFATWVLFVRSLCSRVIGGEGVGVFSIISYLRLIGATHLNNRSCEVWVQLHKFSLSFSS